MEILKKLLARDKVKEKISTLPPSYHTVYGDITPNQLAGCNLPDSSFNSYHLDIDHEELPCDSAFYESYKLSIHCPGKWEDEKRDHSGIRLRYLNSDRLDFTDLGKFLSVARKIHNLAQNLGEAQWTLESRQNFDAEVQIDLYPKEGNEAEVFTTKAQVASFVKRLADGLNISSNGMAYFSRLTMAELLASNLPRESWPTEVSDDKTFREVPLPISDYPPKG